jgi:uncharacterized protein (DUF952 family)
VAAAAFKVLSVLEWETACRSGLFSGSSDDVRDGYIHLSTRETLHDTLRKYFAGQRNLCLIEFDTEDFGDALRWEAARGGVLFPHVYAPIATSIARRVWRLQCDEIVGLTLPNDL